VAGTAFQAAYLLGSTAGILLGVAMSRMRAEPWTTQGLLMSTHRPGRYFASHPGAYRLSLAGAAGTALYAALRAMRTRRPARPLDGTGHRGSDDHSALRTPDEQPHLTGQP
jgi:hypothetical protein